MRNLIIFLLLVSVISAVAQGEPEDVEYYEMVIPEGAPEELEPMAVPEEAPAADNLSAVDTMLDQFQVVVDNSMLMEKEINLAVDTIAVVLNAHDCPIAEVKSLPGQPLYANEQAIRNNAVVAYCQDPATIGKLKKDLTDEEMATLTALKSRMEPEALVLNLLTEAAATMGPQVGAFMLSVPVAIMAGAPTAGVDTAALSMKLMTLAPLATTVPQRILTMVQTEKAIKDFLDSVL